MPSKPPNPRMPTGLGAAGRQLWTRLTEHLEFEPREVAVLQAACRQADDIARLEAVLKSEGASAKGSKGQSRLHPAIPELRQARLALVRMLASLDLPDVEEVPRSTKSTRAQHAANVRWSRVARAAAGG